MHGGHSIRVILARFFLLILMIRKSNLLVWNCQEAGHPRFHRCWKKYLRDFDSDVVILVETRVSGCTTACVVRRIGFSNSYRIEACGYMGGI